MSDDPVEAACIAMWRDTAEFHMVGMRRAIAAAYEAEAAGDFGHPFATALISEWLRMRATAIKGAADEQG